MSDDIKLRFPPVPYVYEPALIATVTLPPMMPDQAFLDALDHAARMSGKSCLDSHDRAAEPRTTTGLRSVTRNDDFAEKNDVPVQDA